MLIAKQAKATSNIIISDPKQTLRLGLFTCSGAEIIQKTNTRTEGRKGLKGRLHMIHSMLFDTGVCQSDKVTKIKTTKKDKEKTKKNTKKMKREK